jgi:7-carboxy-7-deazaguanine synthase
MTKVRVSEIFYSLEGEGPYSGQPTLFIRLYGCNFTCSGFSNAEHKPLVYKKEELTNKFQYEQGCDSAYSWHPAFKDSTKWYTIDELTTTVLAMVYNLPRKPILCFTGGEPMLYQTAVAEFLKNGEIFSSFDHILIETNGTQLPSIDLIAVLNHYRVSWSNSPKLSSSGEKWEEAIIPEVYAKQRGSNTGYLKFVSDGSDESFKEIEKAIDEINTYLSHPTVVDKEYWVESYSLQHIWIMPMGSTKQQQEQIQRKVAEECLKRGYNFCARIHVWVFDNEVGT